MAEKLRRLRAWLTRQEAAAYLSQALGEEVTEAEVLRHGLDGDLTLSVRFVNAVEGMLGRVVPPDQAGPFRTFSIEDKIAVTTVCQNVPVSECGVVQFATPEKVVRIDGVWDLPMVGTESRLVEDQYQVLTDGRRLQQTIDLRGTWLTGSNGEWCRLYKIDSTATRTILLPDHELPDDAVLVVRTTALEDLVRRTLAQQEGHEAGAKPDFSWKHVTMRFTGKESVQITVGGSVLPEQGYEELGFAYERSKNPNRAWTMLRLLAKNGGTLELTSGQFAPGRSQARKTIQELRTILRDLVKTDADPVPFKKGIGYTTAFKIEPDTAFD